MTDRLGAFEVIRELGRGGMGVVYLARDTRLDRQVAIKALPVDLASDPVRLERFEREAKTLASLNHPNLAGIHGVEEQDGARHLVLEYVEGESLAERLDRGPLPVDEALEYAVQIAAGVEAAHEAGVVHRDLKPANVMITPDGQAKVLDFGLARTDDGASSTGSLDSPTMTTPQNSPTIAGAILGTAAYMSPEQARGRRIDKRTDIWSFGVVLYEMLVGASPFVGETASDSIGAVLHKSFDLEQLPAQTPKHVRRVLERCLERDKALRYRDIGDVRIELMASSGQSETTEAVEPSRPSRRGLLVLGWAAAAVLAVAVAIVVMRPVPQAPSVYASALLPDGVRVLHVEISPDGESMVLIGQAFDADREDVSFRTQGYVRELASGEATLVEGAFDPFCAAFSPDGRWLLFACDSSDSNSELVRVPADLSAPPAVIGNLGPTAYVAGRVWFTWTPDSNIAHLDNGTRELVIVDPGSGREVRRLPFSGVEVDGVLGNFTGPFGEHWVSIDNPAYSDSGFREDALLIDVRTGEVTRVVADATNLVSVGRNRVMFARGTQILESGFDASSLSIQGEIRPVHNGLSVPVPWADGRFALSESGTLAFVPGGLQGSARSIALLDFEMNETPWSDERRSFESAIAISPDGQKLAAVVSTPSGLYEVWVADTERRRFRRLISEPGRDFNNPCFSPDGMHVFASRTKPDFEGMTQIVKVPFDGDGERQMVFSPAEPAFVRVQDVSADGARMLLTAMSLEGRLRVLESSLSEDTEPRELAGFHPTVASPVYFPGGLPLICYLSSESGRRQLYLRRYEDGQLGPEIAITDEEVLGFGFIAFTETSAQLSYLTVDRRVLKREITIDGRIRVGPSELIQKTATRSVEVSFAPNVGMAAIKFGEDEAPITRVDVITNWLNAIEP